MTKKKIITNGRERWVSDLLLNLDLTDEFELIFDREKIESLIGIDKLIKMRDSSDYVFNIVDYTDTKFVSLFDNLDESRYLLSINGLYYLLVSNKESLFKLFILLDENNDDTDIRLIYGLENNLYVFKSGAGEVSILEKTSRTS